MRYSSIAALAATASVAVAQTFTDCDPTAKSCPADTGLNAQTFTADFMSGSSDAFSAAAYSSLTYGSQGAEFSISKEGQAPTVQTNFYVFFGRVDVKMRAAPGTGIVSSIVLESDDLDEIDWEFLGGNTTVVETNFFGKGNTTSYDRAIYYPVSEPQSEFHTYSVDWNAERVQWIIDGTTVRTLTYDDSSTVGGKNYPQTPMRLKLGSWCAGCDGEPKGTVEWAGGKTTFDDAPYVMYVESVNILNSNPADSYEYGDQSGSWQSINIINGGDSSNPSGGTGGSHVSGSPSASASGIAYGNQTVAPTQSHSVGHIMNTAAAVSKTITGSNYSATGKHGGNTVMTSVVLSTTHLPGASPTGGSVGGAGGEGGAGGLGANPSASASGSDGASTQTGSATAVGVSTAAVLGMLFSFLML